VPKVSVMVTTRNRAKMLHGCIQAILDQTYKDIEVVVVDDCSTDNTSEIVKLFADPRLIYVRRSVHGGSPVAWEEGLRRSRGEFVLHTHDDDILHPTIVDRELEMMERYPRMTLVGTNARIIDEDGHVTQARHDSDVADRTFREGQYIPAYMEERFHLKCSTHMIRVKAVPPIRAKTECRPWGGSAPPVHIGPLGDIFTVCQCNMYGWVGYIADPLIDYRVHNGSETFQLDITPSDIALHEEMLSMCKTLGKLDVIPMVKASLLRHRVLDALMKGNPTDKLLGELAEVEAGHPPKYSLPAIPDGRTSKLRGKTVAIFGSFLNSHLLAEDCIVSGVRVTCFLDDNVKRQGHRMSGTHIYPTDWLSDHAVDAVLLSNERRPKEQAEARIRRFNTEVPIFHWKEFPL